MICGEANMELLKATPFSSFTREVMLQAESIRFLVLAHADVG